MRKGWPEFIVWALGMTVPVAIHYLFLNYFEPNMARVENCADTQCRVAAAYGLMLYALANAGTSGVILGILNIQIWLKIIGWIVWAALFAVILPVWGIALSMTYGLAIILGQGMLSFLTYLFPKLQPRGPDEIA